MVIKTAPEIRQSLRAIAASQFLTAFLINFCTLSSEETLDQLDSGITMSVVSKNKNLASKKFVMDDVRKRFTNDALIVIYACHGAVTNPETYLELRDNAC